MSNLKGIPNRPCDTKFNNCSIWYEKLPHGDYEIVMLDQTIDAIKEAIASRIVRDNMKSTLYEKFHLEEIYSAIRNKIKNMV